MAAHFNGISIGITRRPFAVLTPVFMKLTIPAVEFRGIV